MLDVTVLDISIVVVNNLLYCYTCNDLECCFCTLLICSCKFMMDVHKLVVTLGTCTVSNCNYPMIYTFQAYRELSFTKK